MSGVIPATSSSSGSLGDNRSASQWPPQQPGGAPYPQMPKVGDDKPLLTSLGASGVAIFSGIITSEEYNPDFYWRDGVKIYEQMLRSDGQIRAIRTVLENPIKRAKWHIKPGSNDPRDKEIASFVETCLLHDMCYTTSEGRTRRQNWAQILHHILMHLWYGFMSFEIDWRVEDGWVKWAKWQPLLPRTIWRWWVGADTELVGVQQWTFKDYNYAFTDIPADKLLLFVCQQEGSNFEGLSLLRTAYKHWWYKQNLEKIEAIGIERNAVPPPVISLPVNFTSNDVAMAQQIGANMRASEMGYVTLPPGWLLEYPRGMQPLTDKIQPAIQYHDVMIARNVLAQFINLGSTETGAYALADAQQEMFLEALEAVTDYICDTINSDAIRRLVDYNFDNVAVYPQLEASALANADITQLADAVSKLKARDANFLTPDPEMEDYLREQFHFPAAPKNAVQATNPTAQSDPARPENANAQDHSDAESANQVTNPQTQTNQSQQSEATAGNNAIAPASPGDGGVLSEASVASGALVEEARLLREAVAAITDLDVVERGMRFFNPNHDPHSGQFSSGDGGSGGSAGRGTNEERRAAGNEIIRQHQATATGHYNVPNEALLRAVGTGRATKAQYEAVVGRTVTDAEYNEWRTARTGKSATTSKRESESATKSRGARSGGSASSGRAESSGEAKQGTAAERQHTHEAEAARHETTAHALIAQRNAADVSGNKAETDRLHAEAQTHFQAAKQEGLAAQREATVARSQDVHGNQVAEVKPGSEHLTPLVNTQDEGEQTYLRTEFPDAFRNDAGEVRGTLQLNTRAPDARLIAHAYGEHQTGAIMSRFSAKELRASAEEAGLETTGSKEELVSRLTAHATEGRYDASFGKTSGGAKSEKTESTDSLEDIHARSAQLQREGHLPAEATPEMDARDEVHPIRTYDSHEAEIAARFGPDATEINVGATPNPYFYAYMNGEHQLGAVLSRFPQSRLREIAQAYDIKPAASKAGTISRITAHVTQGRYSANFGGNVTGRSSSRSSSGGTRSRDPFAAHAAKATRLKAALDKAQAAYDAHMATAPKLSEQSAHAREAARLLAEVERARVALERFGE